MIRRTKVLTNPVKIADRVDRGASLLDLHRPDWEDEIQWGSLVMSSKSMSITGQLYGSDERAEAALGIDMEQSMAMGFAESANSWRIQAGKPPSFRITKDGRKVSPPWWE